MAKEGLVRSRVE